MARSKHQDSEHAAATHDTLKTPTLARGEPRYFEIPADEDVAYLEAMSDWMHPKGYELHFAGCLLYEDFDGVKRRSVFRRYYDQRQGGFYRTDDPDDEYAD